MTNDAVRLAAIVARVENATPGPWVDVYHPEGGYDAFTNAWQVEGAQGPIAVLDQYFYGQRGDAVNEPEWISSVAASNVQFIAHAREDIPWLLHKIARLTASVMDLERAIESKYFENRRLDAPAVEHVNQMRRWNDKGNSTLKDGL